jgi:superfamily II DNA or RNA helicase
MEEITKGSILEGFFWPDKIRVIDIKEYGENRVRIEGIGCNTNKYYNSILTKDDLDKVKILRRTENLFSDDGNDVFLFLESERIKNSFQFDPLCAVTVSQIDPLPHQIDAVYHHILKKPRIRFLLADDPGAGKTIMAGLLLKELKYRGLVDKTLIVVPGHLKEQWRRELKDRFQENFSVVDRGIINASWGLNIFNERKNIIISMDFAKRDDVKEALSATKWDLCIVDEAHKMSAYKYGKKTEKTRRYTLGELVSNISNNILFLTATPHSGDPENFRLLLNLLEPGFFANTEMLSESIQSKDNPLILRRLKEDLKDFDGRPIFPPRVVETISYNLSNDEKNLYIEVTNYVKTQFNKALSKDKRNVTFAMTILQRRLASSVYSVKKSLERRRNRLGEIYEKWQMIREDTEFDEDDMEDLEEKDRWDLEDDILERLTSAATREELKEEIETLDRLVNLARAVEKREVETKLNELRRVMEIDTSAKLLIFTEFKDTLDYLVERLRGWGYSVTSIHGRMNMDERIGAENEFNNTSTQIMVSTEAGGEGINLQKSCWLMVNYDIPWNPNRLEQRMGRIHRYGQQHEVHIYNMVAGETIEGTILNKIFTKLSEIRRQMGSDRVFDVINVVWRGVSLKDLIMDAIINKRTIDDIVNEIEREPDMEAIKRVKTASLEALATRHIDLSKILADQREAKENRLVPEYIEKFFLKAAENLGIKMEKRGDLWRITSVPFDLRKNQYEFRVKFGEVQREYSKVSFDKKTAFKSQAEFIAMGHPLLESMIDYIQKNYAESAQKGAIFVDPAGKRDGVIWFLDAEIKDGNDEVAGKKLFAVFQDKNNTDEENTENRFFLINPDILWDLKPEKIECEEIMLDKEGVVSFVINEAIDEYKTDLLERRERDATIKKKYGISSLNTMLAESIAKIDSYQIRRIKGEDIPEATIQNEERRKEEILSKRRRLEREIEGEVHLYPTEPIILGIVRVVPAREQKEDMVRDEEIERIGMEVAMRYEMDNGRRPEDVSAKNSGYDIKSSNDRECRYIEVKARAQDGSIALTPNEWMMAQRLGDEYWLYIITNAATRPRLYLIQNPALRLRPDEEVSIVRYVVKDWKGSAEVAE